MTTALEAARLDKLIGASLQAAITVPPALLGLLDADAWAEVAIVSAASPGDALHVSRAPGDKCARCWRVLPEVGSQPSHPALCVRCADVVEGLSCQAAAE